MRSPGCCETFEPVNGYHFSKVSLLEGEMYGKGAPLSMVRPESDASSLFLIYLPGNKEPKTASLGTLGAKKPLEQLLLNLFCHPYSVVHDIEPDAVLRGGSQSRRIQRACMLRRHELHRRRSHHPGARQIHARSGTPGRGGHGRRDEDEPQRC